MSIDINKLTIGEVKEIASMVGCTAPQSSIPNIKIGTDVLIRTVTYHMIGTLQEIRGAWVRLSECSWVASSGQWGHALATGELDEVEYHGLEGWVNLDTATDVYVWPHELPSTTK